MPKPAALSRRYRFPAEIINHSGLALLPLSSQLPWCRRDDGQQRSHSHLRDHSWMVPQVWPDLRQQLTPSAPSTWRPVALTRLR